MAEENKVQWVYASRNNQELQQRYNTWAKDYEEDLESNFGWLGTEIAAEMLQKHANDKSIMILDAGAGTTGLMGEKLWALGHRDITAMDMS